MTQHATYVILKSDQKLKMDPLIDLRLKAYILENNESVENCLILTLNIIMYIIINRIIVHE